jgi:S1-C subfamily serine protease
MTIRRRAWPPGLVLFAALAIPAPQALAGPDIVTCYDATRKLVTHVLPHLCEGEIITAEREAELAAERRQRIQSTVQSRIVADPVTGERRLIGTGSGFYISQAGDLLTNNHVVNHCDLLTATPDDGGKLAARIVAASPQPDIALLRTDQSAPGVASFSAAPERSDGRRLAVVGYPAYGLPTRLSTLSPAQIEPHLLGTQASRIQFNGEIRHGNSGSPLLDQSGDVLGVVYATIDTPKVYATTRKLVTDIGVSISYSATLQFLAANSVTPTIATGPPANLTPEQLHAKSRSFVVQIGCWK